MQVLSKCIIYNVAEFCVLSHCAVLEINLFDFQFTHKFDQIGRHATIACNKYMCKEDLGILQLFLAKQLLLRLRRDSILTNKIAGGS